MQSHWALSNRSSWLNPGNISYISSTDQHRTAASATSVQDFTDAEVECKFNRKKGDPAKDVIPNWFEECPGTIQWVLSPGIRRQLFTWWQISGTVSYLVG